MRKIKKIGIIAEDSSDIDSVAVLIKRITLNDSLSFKSRKGDGCGKIKRKALNWSKELKIQGCDMLVLLHDLDRNKFNELYTELNEKLKNCPILDKIICIPIEEIEAWFLSDPTGIKNTFNLKKTPKFDGNPEEINDPKSKLKNQISLCSERSVEYLNTKHNKQLSEKVSIDILRSRCSSFNNLYEFLKQYKY